MPDNQHSKVTSNPLPLGGGREGAAREGASHSLNRRDFLRRLGMGSASALSMLALGPLQSLAATHTEPASTGEDNKMTYRRQNGSGENISLLGFGMMRLPREQEEVDRLVDYAIAHGVNYFDTAPMYGRGHNEEVTGRTLSRFPRDKYYVATKMSNMGQDQWALDRSRQMYENSFRQLRVDNIDYYLLHSVGGGGMDALHGRFLDNGLLDFLLREREAGRIRHLGFSYHGDVEVFDFLLDHNDEYHWDFVQIQMNYVDWRHAGRGRRRSDADAEYLYGKLKKLGIQAVVMEPIRGGSLANVSSEVRQQLADVRPDDSPASWGFRWVGSHDNILTTLSGMNRMEHLEENVRTFSPLQPCTDAENALLASIADQMAGVPTIGCTTCAYCMPCPYGVDIPGNFAFYNKYITEHSAALPTGSPGALPSGSSATPSGSPAAVPSGSPEGQDAFIRAYRAALPAEKRATSCVDCGQCLPKCPQQIRIPNQMSRIVELTRKKS